MDAGVKLTVIAAVAENGVIGRDGDLPWRLSDDLRRFARLTKGATVIVGRRTFEAIIKKVGGPLPDRRTVIVSTTTNPHAYAGMGCAIVSSLEHALGVARSWSSDPFVIGGAQLYREALPLAGRLLLTCVHAAVDGDTLFPPLDWAEWQDEWFEFRDADERNDHPTTFVAFRRRPKRVWPAAAQVEMANARFDDQHAVMQGILESGVCPFCPEHEGVSQLGALRRRGHFWTLRDNRWPYDGARVHLLAILNEHGESLADVRPSAMPELLHLLQWSEQTSTITSGGLALRFGEPSGNGGTVRHLHAHLIAAGDPNDPSYETVRFRLGPRAAAKKHPHAC